MYVNILINNKRFDFVSVLGQPISIPDADFQKFTYFVSLNMTVVRRFSKVPICSISVFHHIF
jgi:hypothetical protein